MLKRDPFTGEIPYFRNLNGDFHSLYHFPFQPAGVWLTVYSMSFVSAASTQTLGLWTWPCCTDTAASSTRSSRWVSTAASPCAGMPRIQKDRCRMTQSHSRFTLWQWVNLLWDCVILFPLLLLTSNLCFLFARCHSDYILLVICHDVQLTGRSGSTAYVHSQNAHINTDLCYVFIPHQAAHLLLPSLVHCSLKLFQDLPDRRASKNKTVLIFKVLYKTKHYG